MNIATSPAESYADPSWRLRFEALLRVADVIATHRDMASLIAVLADQLRAVVTFDFVSVSLYDEQTKRITLRLLEAPPGPEPPKREYPVEKSAAGWVVLNQQRIYIPDLEQHPRNTELLQYAYQRGIRSLGALPLTTAQRKIGALGFGSFDANRYSKEDLEFMSKVAGQVALALDNALNCESARQYQEELKKQKSRLETVLDINNALVSNLGDQELFAAISAGLRKVVRIDYTSLAVYDPEQDALLLHSCELMSLLGRTSECMQMRIDLEAPWRVIRTRRPAVLDFEEMQQIPDLAKAGFRSGCIVPILKNDRVLGTLNVASRRDNAFLSEEVELLMQLAQQVALAVENNRIYRELGKLKDHLAQEKLYLEDEIRSELNFEDIIGESSALKQVLSQVETVAPSDSTVLILGETGTGKELIARAIHNLSRRKERTFVKLNCAAIPTGLLESELFGHERGAFTGAISRKIGRLELAHKGTLFLDEVGDIPPELQPKLLRALQEREFERLGSTQTQHSDLRLVAATNRDLKSMIAERQFRSDLYYRLNVFPIYTPPLRERTQDIPVLVRHFAQKYARRMDKSIQTVPNESMEALTHWHWPGNVRELENFIERAVILTQGSVLKVPVSELKAAHDEVNGTAPTLQNVERDHIIRALREARGVIGGQNGAASLLGLKRTTLISRMQKLGISARELFVSRPT